MRGAGAARKPWAETVAKMLAPARRRELENCMLAGRKACSEC